MFYSVFNGTLEEKGYFYGRESSFQTGWGKYWDNLENVEKIGKKCEQNGWKVLTNCVKRNTVIVLNSGISGVTRPKFIHVWEYKYRHD